MLGIWVFIPSGAELATPRGYWKLSDDLWVPNVFRQFELIRTLRNFAGEPLRYLLPRGCRRLRFIKSKHPVDCSTFQWHLLVFRNHSSTKRHPRRVLGVEVFKTKKRTNYPRRMLCKISIWKKLLSAKAFYIICKQIGLIILCSSKSSKVHNAVPTRVS